MKRSNKAFVSDPRNIGGRTQILELMQNHQSSLRQIKPVLRITSPHPHVDSMKPMHTLIQGTSFIQIPIVTTKDPTYAFVRATYRTIAGMGRGLIDRKQPATFGLIEKLSENKKYNHHALGEHLKNLISLQKRLKRIESGNVRFLGSIQSIPLDT